MPTALIFAGHMVDLPGRGTPRFPQQLAETARRMIADRLIPFLGQPGIAGIGSLARGGDILFHEECRKLKIPTTIVLPFAPADFVVQSVKGVPESDWETRFWSLWNETLDEYRQVLNLPVSDAAYAACNARVLEEATAHGQPHLLALWDGKPGDGPGGAGDLVERAKEAGDRPDTFFFKSCFVVMGYAEKTDIATGRKLNLDATYKNVIKPAVEAAGFVCVRADEILHSGVIDIPMYDMLLDADLVVADLSTSNLNAMFELGVRHGLRPRRTIIIAEKQFVSPFDVNHIVINKYEHLGPDIGYGETTRIRGVLTQLARQNYDWADSPVYASMQSLDPPRRIAVAAAGGVPQASLRLADVVKSSEESYAAQFEQAAIEKTEETGLPARPY